MEDQYYKKNISINVKNNLSYICFNNIPIQYTGVQGIIALSSSLSFIQYTYLCSRRR